VGIDDDAPDDMAADEEAIIGGLREKSLDHHRTDIQGKGGVLSDV
jgi:hypothetical protein